MYASIHISIHKVLNTGRMQMEEEGAVYGLMCCCLRFVQYLSLKLKQLERLFQHKINIKCHDFCYVNMSGVE